jgi:HAD superfamily phosphoserine phosphatase-like hydrolase
MKLAIFDFDGTLLMTDTLPALAKEWTKQHLPRMNYYIMYLSIIPLLIGHKMGLLSRERFRYLAVVSFNRIYHKMTRQEIGDFFEGAYAGLAAQFNPAVLHELQEAISQGYCCVLVSGAYTDLLQVIAKYLAIDMVVGSEMAFKDGIFDLSKKPAIVEGQGKLELLKRAIGGESIDWQASRSYGNSYSDLEVMEIVGEPVAVNPEPRLLAHALDNQWRVITISA